MFSSIEEPVLRSPSTTATTLDEQNKTNRETKPVARLKEELKAEASKSRKPGVPSSALYLSWVLIALAFVTCFCCQLPVCGCFFGIFAVVCFLAPLQGLMPKEVKLPKDQQLIREDGREVTPTKDIKQQDKIEPQPDSSQRTSDKEVITTSDQAQATQDVVVVNPDGIAEKYNEAQKPEEENQNKGKKEEAFEVAKERKEGEEAEKATKKKNVTGVVDQKELEKLLSERAAKKPLEPKPLTLLGVGWWTWVIGALVVMCCACINPPLFCGLLILVAIGIALWYVLPLIYTVATNSVSDTISSVLPQGETLSSFMSTCLSWGWVILIYGIIAIVCGVLGLVIASHPIEIKHMIINSGEGIWAIGSNAVSVFIVGQAAYLLWQYYYR